MLLGVGAASTAVMVRATRRFAFVLPLLLPVGLGVPVDTRKVPFMCDDLNANGEFRFCESDVNHNEMNKLCPLVMSNEDFCQDDRSKQKCSKVVARGDCTSEDKKRRKHADEHCCHSCRSHRQLHEGKALPVPNRTAMERARATVSTVYMYPETCVDPSAHPCRHASTTAPHTPAAHTTSVCRGAAMSWRPAKICPRRLAGWATLSSS